VSLQPALPFYELPRRTNASLKLIQLNTLFNNPTIDRSLQWIRAEKPDFVMLQEVSNKTRAIYDGLAAELPFGTICKFATVGGVAVRSRHPMKSDACKESLGFAWIQVDVNGKALTLASLHLHWPYPFRQRQQLQSLAASFKAMPRPVLLTGDFNAAPWSAATQLVAQQTGTTIVPGLRFTLRMGAFGFGPIPFLPIDHVLVPADVRAHSIKLGPPIGSDHLPVIVEFSF
jgi:endonuclease/exonuclease/phosphatase (EEP) superfamily protein YafD